MRLCEATMPDVPSGVGWTGVSYSFGYIAFCASTARRSFSSASVSGTVRIQVIRSHNLDGGGYGWSTKDKKVHGHAEGDDPDPQRRAQWIVAGEQEQQHGDQNQKQYRRDWISPGAVGRSGHAAPDPEQSSHRQTDKQHRHEDEVPDDLVERAERHVERRDGRLDRDRASWSAEARMDSGNGLEKHPVVRHRVVDARQRHEQPEQAAEHRDDHDP